MVGGVERKVADKECGALDDIVGNCGKSQSDEDDQNKKINEEKEKGKREEGKSTEFGFGSGGVDVVLLDIVHFLLIFFVFLIFLVIIIIEIIIVVFVLVIIELLVLDNNLRDVTFIIRHLLGLDRGLDCGLGVLVSSLSLDRRALEGLRIVGTGEFDELFGFVDGLLLEFGDLLHRLDLEELVLWQREINGHGSSKKLESVGFFNGLLPNTKR